jgi:hypothetical protein
MSATTTTTAPVEIRSRARVGWSDFAWVTWRQHRWLIGFTTIAALGTTGFMLWLAARTNTPGSDQAWVGFLDQSARSASQTVAAVPISFGAFVAVFWAAPLLSREYEQKTHLVAWSQDVTPVRWLVGKVVLLGAVVVGIAAALGAAMNLLMNRMNAAANGGPIFRLFGEEAFENVVHVQIGYAAFGLALGLAVSAVTRRTVLSMGLTLGIFFFVRITFASFVRRYYETPLRLETPLDSHTDFSYNTLVGQSSLLVDGGYLDAAGNTRDYPDACMRSFDGPDGYDNCLRDNGIVKSFTDYQPIDRLPAFQVIEFAIFSGLAAALFALAWFMVRRAHRV